MKEIVSVRTKTTKANKNQLVTALVANATGEIFEIEGYAAVGMAGSALVPLRIDNTLDMPYGGELMFLPDRRPIVYNIQEKKIQTLFENPYVPGESILPVAAFNSPGYVISYTSAYKEDADAGYLPLFSYGAVGWHAGNFRSAIIRVDKERRQDLRLMKREDVIAGIRKIKKKMPDNRLVKHIEHCALTYGCPAAKNFFLARYEAPLPTSRQCNARCLGCISFQKTDDFPSSHKRISFTPTPQEIAQISLEHIKNVNECVLSFGQGCEGDPLMAADVIEQALMLIRSKTESGTINMNTNASRPDILERLFDVGLDSIRVSMNSAREECYNAYFRPNGYCFSDVKKSIDIALQRGKHVAVNYLNCPGFTDTPEEVDALVLFLKTHPLHMIQWRNLNFDPARYCAIMRAVSRQGRPMGIKKILKRIKETFPGLKYGYFNPPKEKFGR
jgi:pyruvate-formate lyase-activating enzyme